MVLNRWISAVAVLGFFTTSCGTQEEIQHSEHKIVGGQPVLENQNDPRRWSTVALTTDVVSKTNPGAGSPLKQGKSFCTGTILSKTVIMTAAHCLQAMDPQTRQKKNELNLPKETDFLVFFGTKVSENGKYIRAKRVIPHPEWDPNTTLQPQPASNPKDIGLIILSEEIPAGYAPTELAPASMEIAQGTTVSLAGFGVSMSRNNNDTGILRQVDVPITGIDATAKRIGVGALLRGACAGDSGGPLFVKNGSKWFVAGATSTGAEIAGICLGLMNNYTDARYFADWFQATVAAAR